MGRTPRTYQKNASAMRMLGQILATLRQAAGYTQESLSERVRAEYATIAAIEQGRRPLKASLAAELDVVLDTNGVLSVGVEHMPEIDLIPRWVEEYLDLEQVAIDLRYFGNAVLPGLLQTPKYALTVFGSRIPAYSQEKIEELTAKRLARRDLLHRETPTNITFVIWEAVLMDRIGGPAVYAEQLEQLRADADVPGVSLQILPLGRAVHAGLAGPFTLMETEDHQHLAYTETQRGSQLVGNPDEVSALAQKYAMLRAQALNPEETKALLDRKLGAP